MARFPIPTTSRRLVTRRARGLCEYCLVHEQDAGFTHQVDHWRAVKHGGDNNPENLVLACLLCNRYKGSDMATFDPETGAFVMLFNPRTQSWSEHFVLAGVEILGLTATGRATVQLLRLNEAARLVDRRVLRDVGRYPLN